MKYLLLSILLVTLVNDPLRIFKINRAESEAKAAYNNGDYNTAIKKYRYLIDSLQVVDDAVVLNLANAYYLKKDTAQALTNYQNLTTSGDHIIRSKAQQQLGLMHYQQSKYDEALSNFKQAIKSDGENMMARYNYEMLKKKLDEKKKEEEKNKKQDQNKDNKPKEPSAFAKRLKAQAEALAAQFKFEDAFNLMNEGAKKDASVMYYSDFIQRLGDVTTIKKNK
jgi:hypothetical protein